MEARLLRQQGTVTDPADSLDRRSSRPAIRAMAFDLDGTLVDSAADLMHASNALLAELGRPPVDLPAVRSFVGDNEHGVAATRAGSDSTPPPLPGANGEPAA